MLFQRLFSANMPCYKDCNLLYTHTKLIFWLTPYSKRINFISIFLKFNRMDIFNAFLADQTQDYHSLVHETKDGDVFIIPVVRLNPEKWKKADMFLMTHIQTHSNTAINIHTHINHITICWHFLLTTTELKHTEQTKSIEHLILSLAATAYRFKIFIHFPPV